MKRLVILSLALFVGFMMSVYAQNAHPTFPGGEEALRNYLTENIQKQEKSFSGTRSFIRHGKIFCCSYSKIPLGMV